MVLKTVKKLPTKYKRLGVSRKKNMKGVFFNQGGEAVGYVYSNALKEWIVSKKWSWQGLALRSMGFEVNAGGNLFRHYTLPKNAFVGKTKLQIIKLQRNAGR